ncbi:P-loop containing nucleoside triphosphate hydrolase protein [Serendipita vermifera]|nr:P-loop containing nucleoside triphosphate hydrolase protein [Serendipita vermifera]
MDKSKDADALPDIEKQAFPASHSIKAATKDSTDTEDDQIVENSKEVDRTGYDDIRNAPPPSGTLEDAPISKETTSSFFTQLYFAWVTPLMTLGYTRPLEAVDLWKLSEDRSAEVIGKAIAESFQRRHEAAEAYNKRLDAGEIKPAMHKRILWTVRGDYDKRLNNWKAKDGRRKASLTLAMNDAVFWWFWIGGILKLVADVGQMTSPLLVKEIIKFAQKSYAAHLRGTQAPPLGQGVGLAFALFFLQVFSSWGLHHSFYRGSTTGVLLRGGLISAIFNRSLQLTSRSRTNLSNGRLINHISTDVSRIDFCAMFFHIAWSSPIGLIICLILLLVNLGPSALAGFAIFFIGSPLQTWVMKQLFHIRKKAMVWTDKRAKLLQELLSGMRVIKFFTWERPFIKRIGEYRKRELAYIRTLLLIRAGNNAVAFSLPAIAAVVSFITYSAIGHDLDAAIIFTALTLFNLVRLPLMWMPMGLSAIADAASAVERLYDVFVAEIITDQQIIDPDLDVALRVEKATFVWDGAQPEDETKQKSKHSSHAKGANKDSQPTPTAVPPEQAYKLQNIDMTIPKGQLCAIVGAIGSGKSSLLQGIIGEMRKSEGTVTLGGNVSYCPQTAWIQNATIRENICFGKEFDEEKYWKVVKDSCLEADLDMLPNGDMTEVGEKGITLSGGQRQRLNIARAIYFDSDITIFDDPLSALDAHVGKAVFQNVINGALAGKTRILVTHALHFLPLVDHIYVMDNGKIAEEGTYDELVKAGGAFSYLIKQFGAQEDAEKEEEKKEEAEEDPKKRRKALQGAQQMQVEERKKGSVSGKVYAQYFDSAHGKILIPLLILSAIFTQGAVVMSGYWLVYWQEYKWKRPQSFYMTVYACLGVAQALGNFMIGAILSFITFFASKALHKAALKRVMYSPMSFFDTNPLGRIMNRFAKDNTLGDAIRFLNNTVTQIIGSVVLIAIVLPQFLAPMFVIGIVYYYMAVFYRHSAREIKRLDAILRSSLYSHFSESLYGLATIRAYGELERFRRENNKRMDMENRAYWLSVTTQRWLGIRLDVLGILLTFFVSILAVAARFSISPALTGLTLSYILAVQQAFGWLVRQTAEVENDMNSAERILHYANEIEQEPPSQRPEHKPPPEWPQRGEIQIQNISLRYRPGLPIVLKGISLDIKGGEKIGIIGRTGSGKSSLMACMFRLVELSEGKIMVDGIDISQLGLDDLRSKIAIIPQDPLLFSGTMRTNLDPFNVHDDATLNDALRQSYLIDSPNQEGMSASQSVSSHTAGTSTPVNRFSLDSVIDAEGSNLSVGQRSLVSLARALVVNAQILVLDEATASVDYLTDYRIGNTIARAFKDRTILCIAHRLRTILSYDRVVVLDAGKIHELDTPENLFQNTSGIFRMMCERSAITLDDIRAARKEREELLEVL